MRKTLCLLIGFVSTLQFCAGATPPTLKGLTAVRVVCSKADYSWVSTILKTSGIGVEQYVKSGSPDQKKRWDIHGLLNPTLSVAILLEGPKNSVWVHVYCWGYRRPTYKGPDTKGANETVVLWDKAMTCKPEQSKQVMKRFILKFSKDWQRLNKSRGIAPHIK